MPSGDSVSNQRLDGRSRMKREFHVRFCEGAGGQFPRATRLIMGFEWQSDAERVREVLPKRFQKFGLELHPDKTKLVDFRMPRNLKGPGSKGSSTFDFLGFTHHWGKSLKGNRIIQRKTARSRFSRAIRKTGEWMREVRHWPVEAQHKVLVLGAIQNCHPPAHQN